MYIHGKKIHLICCPCNAVDSRTGEVIHGSSLNAAHVEVRSLIIPITDDMHRIDFYWLIERAIEHEQIKRHKNEMSEFAHFYLYAVLPVDEQNIKIRFATY
ncbi:hypothetical protein VPFG_00362 [Vibrio phage nt-1]|uniref:Uncharacterized protein n=1 Tax=Vibrio phage nt-1 TaxID=115992 RepID=R9TFX2_9CAUD|nr:hypothetical protein VPFG_00362 [Vibrio phage nt-1]AGN30359.1 hypothetical protein VPFG_00362 [Vibrio phage nt-1]